MTLQDVSLLSSQVLHGYLFIEFSLIFTAFMTGLTAGSISSNWILSHWSPSSEEKAFQKLIGAQVTMILFRGVFPSILSLPIPTPEIMFPVLGLMGGFHTGTISPLAIRIS